VFEIKGKKYTVIAIDSKVQFVVVRRDNDGRQFTIRKTSARDQSETAGTAVSETAKE